MAAVFLMQPLGQLLAYGVGLAAVDHLNSSQVSIDKFWRIIVGIGAAPTLLALIFRRNIPESWRYTYFVRKLPAKATSDLTDVYGRAKQRHGVASVELQDRNAQPVPETEPLVAEPDPTAGRNETRSQPIAVRHEAPRVNVSATPGSQFRWSEFKGYLSKDSNLSKLFGVSSCWFLLDVALWVSPSLLHDDMAADNVP